MTPSVCTEKASYSTKILTRLVHFFPKTQQIKSNKVGTTTERPQN